MPKIELTILLRIIFLVGLLLQPLGSAIAVSADSFPPRGSLNVPSELQTLKSEGQKLIKAIRDKEIDAVLRFFPAEETVAIDFDRNMSLREIEHELRTQNGLIYSTLFDSGQLQRISRQRHATSLQDYFLKAPRVAIVVKEWNGISSVRDPLLASLILLWGTRPPEGFFDPVMCRYTGGWKFRTFFTQP